MLAAMIPAAIISKKRDGEKLSREEIKFFIDGFTSGSVSKEQMAALAMAIYFQSMTSEETANLTAAMLESGDRLARTKPGVFRVGKHSTGGLGDKTSLIIAPLLATCGLHVPKLSGRGLGITGGTLDKLESIPGYRTNLSLAEIEKQLDSIGCVITGATGNLVPADKKLYALRDVTGTVPSIPLIASSVMSKKLAENLDALVLDVKYGSGAFMGTKQQAEALAKLMIDIGQQVGVPTEAVLSDMNQPLGVAVGNACEVNEAMDVLQGIGPTEVSNLVIELCSHLLVMTKQSSDHHQASEILRAKLASGEAWRKFEQMVQCQGGKQPANRLLTAPASPLLADRSGTIKSIHGQKLGMAIIQLGGGRKQTEDTIDHRVGLLMKSRIGSVVERGEPLLEILADKEVAPSVQSLLLAAFDIQGN